MVTPSISLLLCPLLTNVLLSFPLHLTYPLTSFLSSPRPTTPPSLSAPPSPFSPYHRFFPLLLFHLFTPFPPAPSSLPPPPPNIPKHWSAPSVHIRANEKTTAGHASKTSSYLYAWEQQSFNAKAPMSWLVSLSHRRIPRLNDHNMK